MKRDLKFIVMGFVAYALPLLAWLIGSVRMTVLLGRPWCMPHIAYVICGIFFIQFVVALALSYFTFVFYKKYRFNHANQHGLYCGGVFVGLFPLAMEGIACVCSIPAVMTGLYWLKGSIRI